MHTRLTHLSLEHPVSKKSNGRPSSPISHSFQVINGWHNSWWAKQTTTPKRGKLTDWARHRDVSCHANPTRSNTPKAITSPSSHTRCILVIFKYFVSFFCLVSAHGSSISPPIRNRKSNPALMKPGPKNAMMSKPR